MLAYQGQWCAPPGLSYGMTVGVSCSTLGRSQQPVRAEGTGKRPGIGTAGSGPVQGCFLGVDPTGRYALVWMAGNVTKSLVSLHGWVHGAYHELAPAVGPYGASFQMTW